MRAARLASSGKADCISVSSARRVDLAALSFSAVIPLGRSRNRIGLVLLKGVHILGLDIRTFAGNAPERAADADAVLSQLVGEGLRPRISAVYPLRAVAEALEAVAAGQTVGKVVLEMANAC